MPITIEAIVLSLKEIFTIILPIPLGIIAYFLKRLINKLDVIEQKFEESVVTIAKLEERQKFIEHKLARLEDDYHDLLHNLRRTGKSR